MVDLGKYPPMGYSAQALQHQMLEIVFLAYINPSLLIFYNLHQVLTISNFLLKEWNLNVLKLRHHGLHFQQ